MREYYNKKGSIEIGYMRLYSAGFFGNDQGIPAVV
jgi:hypothetical protein